MRRDRIFTAIGLLLLAAALFLTVYNVEVSKKAGAAADNAAKKLETEIEKNTDDDSSGELIPSYLLDSDMLQFQIDGRQYIGILTIPALGLKLPVLSEWSYPGLRSAPCRYYGSAYDNNLVIAGHNYTRHFGRLKNLSPGDAVTFTDVEGHVFSYQVAEIDTLQPKAVQEMVSGEWPLTLFTCTLSGQSRVTVRCEEVTQQD